MKTKQFLTITSRSGQRRRLQKYEYRHSNQEIGSLWVRISRGIQQYARHFIPAQTDHQISETASSPQSSSCGRPRAQPTDGHSPVRYEAAPKPKLFAIGFSQRDWKIILATAKHKRNGQFVNMSKHFTNVPRHGVCHEADGAVRR